MYWVIGNIVSIAQYAITTPVNWKQVLTLRPGAPSAPARPAPAKSTPAKPTAAERRRSK
jgi:hypothetical protein